MVAVWAGPGALAYQNLSFGSPHHDSRTAAQRAFDEAVAQMQDTDDEVDAQQALGPIRQRAQSLAPDDPRLVDLQVMQAGTFGEPEHRKQIEAILKGGKDGHQWTRDSLVRSELSALYFRARELPAPERLAQLRDGVQWAERVAPRPLAATLDARLRVAEALDDGGDTGAARKMLTQIRSRAEHADDCRCDLGSVARAQVWFHLSHGESDQALALLRQAPLADRAGSTGRVYSMDHAWALLLGGQTDEGLAQMRIAAYWQPREVRWPDRMTGNPVAQPRLVEPLDLAFALRRAGRDEDARTLLATQGGWRCQASSGSASFGFHEMTAPWQRERDRLLEETARAACPTRARSSS
jgi:hypothetical protein